MYDKINLFDVNLNKNEKYFESKNYAAGKKLVVSDLFVLLVKHKQFVLPKTKAKLKNKLVLDFCGINVFS